MRDEQIKRLALAGVLAAAIILLTVVISIPLPGGHGYINLGDAGVLTAAFVLGGPWGALCGGLASAAADLLLGWGVYAPATLIIKGCMAFFASAMMTTGMKRGTKRLFGVYPAALIVPLGYFLFETLLYGAVVALPNLPLNLVQCLVGAGLAHGVIAVLSKKNVGLPMPSTQGEAAVSNKPEANAVDFVGSQQDVASVKEPEAVTVREPKGGPDFVFFGCKRDVPVLLTAGDHLSVRGYTARIVQLPDGRPLETYPPDERQKLAPDGIPYIDCSQRSPLSETGAKELANEALEVLNP